MNSKNSKSMRLKHSNDDGEVSVGCCSFLRCWVRLFKSLFKKKKVAVVEQEEGLPETAAQNEGPVKETGSVNTEKVTGGIDLNCLEFFEEDFLSAAEVCSAQHQPVPDLALLSLASHHQAPKALPVSWACVVRVAKAKSSWCDFPVPVRPEEVCDSFLEEEELAEAETESEDEAEAAAEEQEAGEDEDEWTVVSGRKGHTVKTTTDCDSAYERKQRKEQEVQEAVRQNLRELRQARGSSGCAAAPRHEHKKQEEGGGAECHAECQKAGQVAGKKNKAKSGGLKSQKKHRNKRGKGGKGKAK